MRRFQISNAALLAGLAVLLSGCSGETPTAPGTVTPPGGVPPGSCATLVTLSATTDSPFAGSGSIVRATVTKNGIPVADGGSVQFSVTLGVFGENGLNTISKSTGGGVADVTVISTTSGAALVTAVYDCARAQKTLQFQGVPDTGPVITSFAPTTGSCAGGDVVTINGVRLGNGTNARVFFGGVEGSVAAGGTSSQIRVTTPARHLSNPSVPESVPVTVSVGGAVSPAASVLFTYACITQKMSVSSINPIAGSQAGGDQVQILGVNFGTTIATTQVTFCGRPAQLISVQDQLITVSTPTHINTNPALSEACDVVVTRDLGLVSQQTATAPRPFIYSGTGGNATCNTDPSFFVSSIAPNTGSPDGGQTVTITGSGFGSNAALLRVDFGGIPATIVGNISNTIITVSSPRRTLANPDVPEAVDVTVTDLGSVNQRCARVTNGYGYNRVILTPVIFSTSPKTGPNDSATRVSIFGDGFQFPMQVFMTGGACGSQLVEGLVSDISVNTIVFKTPVATNNPCLLNQLVDIVIKNPSTNKGATIPAAFKYYACPAASGASPNAANGTVQTTVVVSGTSFEEPVNVNFRANGVAYPLAHTSVSSNAIVVTMPPVSQLLGGSPVCANVDGSIEITFLALACQPNPLTVPFTYRIDPPVAVSAAPNNLNQDGSAFPGPLGTPVQVTVLGSNFVNPMTVQLIKDGVPVSNTPVNNATVANATSLTFTAPAILNSSLNSQNCLLGGSISGTKFVATSFGIRLKSATTGCTVDLPNVLVYNPIDTTCKAALTITTPALPAGQATVAYGPVTMAAVGGTGVGYSWSSSGLPPALSITSGGVISGTPAAAGTFTVTIVVTDSAANSASRVYSLVVNP